LRNSQAEITTSPYALCEGHPIIFLPCCQGVAYIDFLIELDAADATDTHSSQLLKAATVLCFFEAINIWWNGNIGSV